MKWYEWALLAGAAIATYKLLFGDRDRDRERPAYDATGSRIRIRPASPPVNQPNNDTAGAPRSRIRPASPPVNKPGDGGTGAEGVDPENTDADAITPQGGDAKAVRGRASRLISRQEYSGLLDLLEGQPRETLAGTSLVEDLLLEMLKDIRLRHQRDREFDEAIGPHEERVLGLVESVTRERSLEAKVNRSLDKYHSLADYVSRVKMGRESMLDDPGFWPWLDGDYPHVAELLRTDERRITKTNSLVQMLSIKFKSREKAHVGAYMKALDGLCGQVVRICARHACVYAEKANESWSSAGMEMAVLAAVDGCFGVKRIDPEIPGSERLADMSFEHDGREHYVEVYSHSGHEMAAPETKMDIKPEVEWKRRFKKSQITRLRDAGVPTVYVVRVDDFQAQPGETKSQAFCDAAERLMPPDSDIVVILHGVEAASLRGGRAVETSGLAVRLGRAVWEAMPENAAGARP